MLSISALKVTYASATMNTCRVLMEHCHYKRPVMDLYFLHVQLFRTEMGQKVCIFIKMELLVCRK